MAASVIFLALVKATAVFFAGLVFLALARRLPPAARHLICLLALGGSLATLLTALLPEPPIVIHIPSIARLAIANSSDSMRGAGALRLQLSQLALAIWISGCALVMLRFLTGCVLLSKVRRSAVPATAHGRAFAADVSVPMVTGLFHPVILLPQTAEAWPEVYWEAALRHELAHLDRGDLWANFVGAVASAVYWFHPLVWVLVRRMRMEQEAACDDAVVESGFDRVAYAEALLETARHANGVLLASCPMADGAGVKARVIRVLASGDAQPAALAINRRSGGIIGGMAFLLVAVSSAGAERIYEVERDVRLPKVIQKLNPEYTSAARDAKIQGEVLLKMVVGTDGIAREIVVERGIDSGLDRNAVEAVRRWRFQPAMHNGQSVAMKAAVAVNYRLR